LHAPAFYRITRFPLKDMTDAADKLYEITPNELVTKLGQKL
jgi:hypothetical protein